MLQPSAGVVGAARSFPLQCHCSHVVMLKLRQAAALLLLLLCAPECCSVFTYLLEGTMQCFYLELEPQEEVTVYYRCPDLHPQTRTKAYQEARSPQLTTHHTQPLGVIAIACDEDGYVIHEDHLDKEEGSFTFNGADVRGEHHVCFQTNFSHWWGKQKVKFHVDIESGVDAHLQHNPWAPHVANLDDVQELDKQVCMSPALSC